MIFVIIRMNVSTDENSIDWQNLTEDTCLQLMRSHGLDIELKKDLSYDFYD